ncbi:hypothetical protein [Paenibacillus sp. YPG26]|uniref:hypothetical protein n=1 Tax=Paenibacillus sp. YPG26 TaxID=2878915 RepID=UPI00203FD3BC|nr:hypothetical protein [Paenibacillus sp. YPG26]USB32235.1 hypothetical protein LDO05_12985 [Paenibacillus sp. YPG26]
MIIVDMETVKLSQIVMKWFPDMMPVFNSEELNSTILLRDGFTVLNPEDALEIIHYSICEHQSSALLH